MTQSLTKSIKLEAQRLGFQLVGVCPAISPPGFSKFEEWLDAGYHGEMRYLETRKQAYQDPNYVLEGAKSVVMLGLNYQTARPKRVGPGAGRVSRYAWSDVDYHDFIHEKLKILVRYCHSLESSIVARGVVDTAPLLEREFAQLAGLGWQAKNTMLINRQIGSWFFLAAMLINTELQYDQPFETAHCGSCTACLDACPTDAFVKPHVLNASQCISYFTIELRDAIPMEFRDQIGDRVFGCDVCQDVCPWNHKSTPSDLETFEPGPDRNPLPLRALFDLDDDEFRKRFRKTPFWRPRRRGIVRNAAIAMGNKPHPVNIPALSKGLNDGEELIRGASAWALGRHEQSVAKPILKSRLDLEESKDVASEIRLALNELNSVDEP
ncbi:MAG: tRNA epoxyqueuosine(34) reductase QueG [Planctomycetota bacterium]